MPPGRAPRKMMLGTRSRQARTERQRQLPPRVWAAELPSAAEVEKRLVSLFSELPVVGSLREIPISEGNIVRQWYGHFTSFLLLA